MARKKITEHKAKTILFSRWGKPYHGLNVTPENIAKILKKLKSGDRYVFKVDQGVKKRFKNGLIGVDIKKNEISKFAKQFEKKNYNNFILEELVPHEQSDEKYISFERVRDGVKVYYSESGGVDIEDNKDSIQEFLIDEPKDIKTMSNKIKIDMKLLDAIYNLFQEEHFAFLEINPLVDKEGELYILDIAVEVDSAAEYFADTWDADDMIEENLNDHKTKYEEEVEALAEKSQASFRLNVLNKDGSIFMLLSGGGASIVAADEAYQLGFSNEIADYGEYSGNPNTEETFIYTKNVIELLLDSKAKKKVIIIAGGVANFTDVYKTFKGVIMALDKYKDKLSKEGVKVFVRRGGPNEKKGLSIMEEFLKQNNLLGKVTGSEYIMTDIISDAIKFLK